MRRIHLTTFISASEQRVTTLSNSVSLPKELDGKKYPFKHEKYFKPCDNGTIMIDYVDYTMPYGIFGRIFDKLYFYKRLTRLLEERNQKIKRQAEDVNK